MAYRKWKPSKAAAREFVEQMRKIEEFCDKHGISHSISCDSYYFKIGEKRYRVSNHSIEASNRAAYDDFGKLKRELYHDWERDSDTIYIHTSKTRIIEIYTDLLNGYKLNGRGQRVC